MEVKTAIRFDPHTSFGQAHFDLIVFLNVTFNYMVTKNSNVLRATNKCVYTH